MGKDQHETTGRTQWDILISILQSRRAVMWVAITGWLVIAGAVIAITRGVISVRLGSASGVLTCEDFGVTMTPHEDRIGPAEQITLTGGIGSLPKDFQLWVASTGTANSLEYWPRDQVSITNHTWRATISPKLVEPNDLKRFAVFIVGPDGQKLFRLYKQLSAKISANGKWSDLSEKTADMTACDGRHTVALR